MGEINSNSLISLLSLMVQLVSLIYQIAQDKKKSRHYSE